MSVLPDAIIQLKEESYIKLEYNENEILQGLGIGVYKGKFVSNYYPNGKEATIRKFTAPMRSSCKNKCTAPDCTDECNKALDRYFRERKRDLELLRKPDQLHENFIRYICHIKDGDSL